jgi:hypothetical protein
VAVFFRIVALIVAAVGLAGCGLLRGNSYRFRMTVEADKHHGLKSGSGVLEVNASRTPALTSEEKPGSAGLKGEAIVIELPDGPLFALLKNDDAGQPLHVRITQALSSRDTFKGVDDYIAAVRALGSGEHRAELPRADWPLMVRFRDINDPKSVEKVDPAAVGVRRILLETTRDEVTTGIEKRLPWIIAAQNFRYSGTAYGDIYPLPSDAFRSGTR